MDVEAPNSAGPAAAVEPDLYARIRDRLATLSPAKLAVAEYLMDRYVDAALLPAAKLAAAVGVSESVVVRLAVDLGYNGYPDMQAALQQIVRDRLTESTRPATVLSDDGHTVGRAFQSDYQLMRQTYDANPLSALEMAAEAMLAAQRIGVLGLRMGHALAVDLSFRLQLLLGNASVLHQGADTLEDDLRRYGPGDLVVVYDFRPYNDILDAAVTVLRNRGVQIVAVSDSALAPIATDAAVTLLAATEGDYGNGRSLVGAMALANSLLALIHERAGERAEASIRDTMALRMQITANRQRRGRP